MIQEPPKFKNDKIPFIDSYVTYIKNNEHTNKNNKPPDSFRVMTYNVHSFKNYANSDIDSTLFINLIETIDADILCLQEVLEQHAITELLMKRYQYHIFCTADFKGFGNMILSKYRIGQSEVIKFSKDSFYSLKRRCCILATIYITEDRPVGVINAHLEVSNDNDYRVRDVKRIFNFLNSKKVPSNSDIIIAGDFNDDMAPFMFKEYRYISSYYFNSYPYLTSVYHKVIDYIFYNSCSKLDPANTFTYFTDLSDHLPIVSDMVFKKTNPPCKSDFNYHRERYQPSSQIYKIKVNSKPTVGERVIDIPLDNLTPFTLSQLGTETKEFIYNIDKGVKIVVIKPGYNLYKGMPKDIDAANEDIFNMYASAPSWYGTKQIALYYVNNKTSTIHEYVTARNLKLFYLMDTDNIKFLIAKLYKNAKDILVDFFKVRPVINEIGDICPNTFDEITKLRCNMENKCLEDIVNILDNQNCLNLTINYISNKYYKLKITQKLSKIMLYIEVVKVCTGYDMTWEEQFGRIKEWLNEANPRVGKTGDDKFTDGTDTIIFKMNDSYHSHKKEHLNKASVSLGKDQMLAEAIASVLNVDGYISHTVPSLWHRYNIFHEEICIFSSRGAVNKTNVPVEYDIALEETSYPYGNILFKYWTSKI